jgi:uridine kinase
MKKPIFIGVSGGSGSGKTTIVNRICSEVPEKSVAIMEHDSYYKDQSSLTYEQRCKTNYDHPFAFDTDLFVDHIKELKKGNSIQKPIYAQLISYQASSLSCLMVSSQTVVNHVFHCKYIDLICKLGPGIFQGFDYGFF